MDFSLCNFRIFSSIQQDMDTRFVWPIFHTQVRKSIQPAAAASQVRHAADVSWSTFSSHQVAFYITETRLLKPMMCYSQMQFMQAGALKLQPTV